MAQPYNKFNAFQTQLGLGAHNLNSDTLKVYLSADTASATARDAYAAKTEMAEIATGAGYSTPLAVSNTFAAGTGAEIATGILGCANTVKWTAATSGTFTPFKHVVLYNSAIATTAPGLIGYWSDTTTIAPNPEDTYTVTFANSRIFTLA